MSTYSAHSKKVDAVSQAILSRPAGKTVTIRKATPGHQIHDNTWKDRAHRIDVSALTDIIEFTQMTNRDDVKVDVAICEGQVTMGQLARAALERGMLPQVVPEYDNFTCAGLINGEGIQTSCHRYGLFSNTVVQLEVVLGDGSVHTVTPHPNDPENHLFKSTVESYGSIGIVTLVAVSLRPAKPFVRSSFMHFTDRSTFAKAMFAKTRAHAGDFLEGLALSRDSYVIIQSEFADTRDTNDVFFEPGPEHPGELWYYQHIQQRVIVDKRVRIEHDVIPTLQFLFRSMRGAWWMVECHIGFPLLTNRRWFRKLVDKKAEETMNAKGGFGPQSNDDLRCIVLQDMGMKLRRLDEALEYVNRTLGVFPLWVCPVHQKHLDRASSVPRHGDNVPDDESDEFFCDVGIYGEPTVKPFYHRRSVKALIEFVDYPSTWGTTYKTKEQIAEEYREARQRYHAIGVFTGVEDKVTLRDATDDANSTEREIFMFRLRRDYGRFWPIVVPAILALLFGLFFATMFGLGYALTSIAALTRTFMLTAVA